MLLRAIPSSPSDANRRAPLSRCARRGSRTSRAPGTRARRRARPACRAPRRRSACRTGVVSIWWKRSKSRPASARLRPLTASVISDADAFEIAQPDPSNEMPAIRSAVELHVECQAVAAERIVALRGAGGAGQRTVVSRPAVVVEDDFLVEVGSVSDIRKIPATASPPRTSGPCPTAAPRRSRPRRR